MGSYGTQPQNYLESKGKKMKIIVGLGNIGKKYDQTRHNIGFMTVDAMADKLGLTFKQEANHQALIATGLVNNEKVLLVKPTTYMNLSGETVGSLVRYYQLDLADLLVIQDDMDMELGRLRLRTKGSAGGHNGIKSIIAHLKTSEFNRLKFGIAHPKHDQQAVVNFVLGKFNAEDMITVQASLDRAVEIMEAFCQGTSMSELMNQFN